MPLFSTASKRKFSLFLLIHFSVASPLLSAPPFLERVFQVGSRQGHPPATGKDASIEELARNIDWLEHEIDRWGTVVAKSPDVWGEARLTKYRAEVEAAFEKDVGAFDYTRISGSQFISDQAFLAASFALKAQAAGITPVTQPTATVSVAQSTTTANNTPSANATQVAVTPLKPFGFDVQNIGLLQNLKLEQTTLLDQKKRYLDHLNELRRMNDGDDVSDSPGYSLNLIRIPVSVLPGKHSQEGYGAEITVTATPELGPELLPVAYRDFVINDLVDQLSVPLVQFLNTDPQRAREIVHQLEAIENRPKILERLSARFSEELIVVSDPDVIDIMVQLEQARKLRFELFQVRTGRFPVVAVNNTHFQSVLIRDITKLQTLLSDFDKYVQQLPALQDSTQAVAARSAEWIAPPPPLASNGLRNDDRLQAQLQSGQFARLQSIHEEVVKKTESLPTDAGKKAYSTQIAGKFAAASALQNANVQQALDELKSLSADLRTLQPEALAITAVNVSSSSRRSTLPFPPSQLLDNYGMHDLGHVALEAYRAFEREIINRQVVHLTDVQSYLREELNAAYDMMTLPAVQTFWEFESGGQRTLVEAVRHRRTQDVDDLRQGFREALAPHLQHSATLTLAWCVFVESLLLNERILDDMQKNGNCPQWLPLFGPNPSIESRTAFAAYVAQRWPVRVFAIDPVTTDQNIADVSSISRQMQLAVALAFAGGEVSASGAMQTLRQLQRDTATIDLNQTVVGFGHGENTFGWRFYPRFQTPPVKGNANVFFRDLLVGGPTDKQLLRTKRLEPGMRECTAIVLMPSFVPGISFDTRANWFKLDNPSHTALSMHETVQYSRSIVAMRENAQACVRCPGRYRPGELERMLRRVEQLEAELPLQTNRVPLPIENSHGGFEIFSSGTRELAPELLGWYGAPGYDPQTGGTFFLAGDNLSIHETKLIVGNADHDFTLLSRQVLQVKLPPGLKVVQDERLKEFHDKLALPNQIEHYIGFVDAHIATPYGVSGHLLIPVIQGSPPASACDCGMKLLTESLKLDISINKDKQLVSGLSAYSLPLLKFSAPASSGLLDRDTKLDFQISSPSGPLAPVSVTSITAVSGGYQLDGIKAIEILKKDGALTVSIYNYLSWLLSRSAEVPAELNLTCQVKATIGGLNVTVGSFPLKIGIITVP